MPFSENLDSNGYFLTPAQLKARFEPLNAQGYGQTEIICYCGSGVTAAHNVLAMRHAGLSEPQLYVGSWSEWCADPARPQATGA